MIIFAASRADDRTDCLSSVRHQSTVRIILHLRPLVMRLRMSTPVKLYATRSSVNPAVALYNALAEDLAAEASESTPAPPTLETDQG